MNIFANVHVYVHVYVYVYVWILCGFWAASYWSVSYWCLSNRWQQPLLQRPLTRVVSSIYRSIFFLRYWCLSNRWEQPLPQRPLKLKKHQAGENRGRNFAKNHDFVPVSINSFDFKQEFYLIFWGDLYGRLPGFWGG